MTRLLITGLALLLVGCGAAPPPGPAASGTDARQEAVARVGDVTLRASVVQTSTLDPAIARRYGIERSDRLAMLLVSLRRGPDGADSSLPARVEARASDLRGRAMMIDMRELRSGELLDYVGTVEIDPPDTIRFDVRISREDGATSSMQFSREFFPR